MRIVTAQQMRAAERAAVEQGGSFLQLMERAGTACAQAMIARYSIVQGSGARVAVVCGKGKNGGDGFVVARTLCAYGCDVTVIRTVAQTQGDEGEMLARLENLPLRVVPGWEAETEAIDLLKRQDYIVDALFGTGLRGALDEKTTFWVQAINASQAPCISIDIPSGIVCDTGEVPGACVHADYTLAIAAQKPAHILQPAAGFCGIVQTVSIGINEACYAERDADGLYTYDMQEIAKLFPQRDACAHKGNFGRALLICGSRNMQGAAVLAAKGAVQVGTGIVVAAFPDAAYPAIAAKLTEPLLLPLPANRQGTFSIAALPELLQQAQRADVVLLGCGLGYNGDTCTLVTRFLAEYEGTVVLDADGINAIADNIHILHRTKANIILTPHPGEMARLTGKPVGTSLEARLAVARDFVRQYALALVLKGANTLVATAETTQVYCNATGNAGMATGGSGDLLAGMLAGLLAQGMPVPQACCSAVYLHGKAGDLAAQRVSQYALTPSVCIDCLPSIFLEIAALRT